MTDSEIVKALELCGRGTVEKCGQCPLYEWNTCQSELPKQALILITRQQAEVKRLQSMNQAKLDMIHDLRKELETVKSEACEEFAERLEPKLTNNTDITAIGYQSVIEVILEAIKEMEREP